MPTLTNQYVLYNSKVVGNTGYGNVTLRTYAKLNSQSGNSSNISVQTRLYTEGAWWTSSTNTRWYAGATGLTTAEGDCSGRFEVGETTLGTLTGDISHNPDGTKQISISSGFVSEPWGWVETISTSVDLPTIQLASTLNNVSNSISTNGSTVTVTPNFTRYSTSYYHILKLYNTDRTTTIATFNGVSTNTGYNLDSTARTKLYTWIGIRTNQVGVICDLETYSSNGGNYLGKSSVLTYFQLPSYSLSFTTKSIEETVTSLNTYKPSGQANSVYIANLSKPKYTFVASSSTGSTYGRNIGYSIGSNSVTSPYTDNNYTGNTLTITASDGRTSTTYTPSITPIPYFRPTLNVSVNRPSPIGSTANITVSGTYYDGNGLTNLATPSVTFTYQEDGGTQQSITISTTTSTSNHKTTFSGTAQISGLNYKKKVTWSCNVSDKLNISTSISSVLKDGRPLWNGYKDSNGENHMSINGDTKVDGNVVVDNIRSKNMFSGFLNGAYNSNTGAFDPTTSGIASSKIPVISGKKYCLSGIQSGNTIRILYWNDNTYATSEVKTTGTSTIITTQGNYMAFQTGVNTPYSNVQLEEGTMATDYKPYQNLDNQELYSNSEIRIGTWLGKPLYRKVYDISNLTSSNSNLVDIRSLNISQIIKISGSIKDNYGNINPIPLYDSSVNYNVLFYNGQYLRGRASLGSGGTISSAYAIIEYTKTTD